MNKKYMFSFLALFAIAMVSAVLINNYGQSVHEIDVESPVEYLGDATYVVEGEYAGQVLEGSELEMINHADFSVLMQISDDSDWTVNDGIETSYKGNLELTKKTVDFNADVWEVLGDKVQIEYTVFGDEFLAEVVAGAIEGYVLIYYADGADRFNNVAKAVDVEDIDENLPYTGDQNAEGGDYDYCETGEYVTCHGAKIWYIPSTAILSGDELDWSRASEFYFESSLIQYNSDGQIVVYPGETLDFTPEFDVNLLFTGTADITTTVSPVVA